MAGFLTVLCKVENKVGTYMIVRNWNILAL